MAIRVDIDEQDILRLQKETARRVDRDAVILASACAVIALGAGAAITGAWRSVQTLQVARVDGGALTAPAIGLAASCLMIFVLIGAAALIVKTRGKHRAARRRGLIKRGLTTGRLEFHFTDAALIVKGGQGTRRALWASLDRIAETKSNIVFWRRDAAFAFLPKNAVKDPALFEKLVRIHGPAVSNKLSTGKNGSADPHRVTFECTERDYEEYRQYVFQGTDASAALVRQLFRWPAWSPILFVLALAFTALAAVAFVTGLSIAAGVVAGIAALSTAFIYRLNSSYFRGPAHPFRKTAQWPYAQSDIVSVALFESGVCVTRSGVEEVYPWSAFDRFAIHPLTAYLVLAPMIVLPVPKRAFSDKLHFQSFTAYARARIKAAGQDAAAMSRASLTRRLTPGAKQKKAIQAPKALPAKRKANAIAAKARPKALPPVAATKPLPAKKKSNSAVDAVRLAAKTRAASAVR